MMNMVKNLHLLLIFLCCLPSLGIAATQISATYENDLQVRLNWNSSSSRVKISYRRTDIEDSWTGVYPPALDGASVHQDYGGIVSPDSASLILPAPGTYIFQLMECAVHPLGSMGSSLTLLCGSSQSYYGGVYNGAVIESSAINLPQHISDAEFTDIPPVINSAGSNTVKATLLNQDGKVQLDWSSSSSFIEMQFRIDSGTWIDVWSATDDYPTMQPSLPSGQPPEEIAPSGSVTLQYGLPGYYQYRMNACGYTTDDRGSTFYRKCTGYVMSNPIRVEAPGTSNLSPIVSFVAPESSTVLTIGDSTALRVQATDYSAGEFLNSSNQIAQVDFYITTQPGQMIAPAQKVYTATAPVNGYYEYTFTPSQPDDYYLVAVATDTDGAQGYAISSLRAVDVPTVEPEPNNTRPVDFKRYAIYYCDFDEDGLRDVYFHGLPLLIILHGDIATPIQLPAPTGFANFGKSDGTYTTTSAWDMTDSAVRQCPGVLKAEKGTHYVLGDMSNDGNEDILVFGENSNVSSLLISGTDGEDVPQVLLEILATGQTRKPGQEASQTPYFTDNLSSSDARITNGQIFVNGVGQTLTNLQKETSTQGAHLATNQNIAAPPGASLPSPSLTAEDLAEIDSISSVGGEFRVNESGAATYAIPLALPAGTAGVTPDVALTYSSQADVGNMGLGWSLAVGSSISRCRQTLQVDGKARPILFTESDRFCLDGQRLLLDNDGAIYGAPGATYTPEIDNGVKVTSVGGTHGHPDYFVVTAKDGGVSTYGGAGLEHHAEHSGHDELGTWQSRRVMAWQLAEFKDSVGNNIDYVYQSTANYHRLASIAYGYGSSSSSTADVLITFRYGTRKKINPYWVAGSRFADNSLLDSIRVSDREKTVREYLITYNRGIYSGGSDSLDRVSNIKSCLGDEHCSRPLRLEWGFASPGAANKGNGKVKTRPSNIFDTAGSNVSKNGFPEELIDLGTSNSSTWSANNVSLANADANVWYQSHLESDINGDGLPDLVVLSAYISGSTRHFTLRTRSQTSTGFGGAVFVTTLTGDPNAVLGRETPELHPMDFNVDGRTDLAVYLPATKKWSTYFSEPQTDGTWKLVRVDGFLPAAVNDDTHRVDNLRFADVNSDGLPDAVYTQNGNLKVHYLKRKTTAETSLTEEQISESSQAYAFSATPDMTTPAPLFDTYNFGGAADMNEDGRVDILGTKLLLSTTTEFGYDFSEVTQTCHYKIDYQLMLASADNMFTAGTEIPALSGQYTVKHSGPNGCDRVGFRRRLKGPILSDINGDGLIDLAWAFGSRGTDSYFQSIHYRLGQKDNSFGPKVEAPLSIQGLALEFMDVNSDGDQDLLITGKDDAKWIVHWEGTAFGSATGHLSASPGRQTVYSDINGDGNLDRSEIKENKLSVTLGVPRSNNAVIRFETGLGAVTSVFYEPLRDSGRYTKLAGFSTEQVGTSPGGTYCYSSPSGGGCGSYESTPIYAVNSTGFYRQINDPFADVDPLTDLQLNKHVPAQELLGAMPVVTRVASSAPIASNARALTGVDYFYEGLKMQAGGRGLLGFKKLATTDLQTGIVTETEYRQDWPFIGTPIKTVTKTHHGQLLKESISKMAIQGVTTENDIIAQRALAATGTANLGPLVLYSKEARDITYQAPAATLAMPDGMSTAPTVTNDVLSEVITITEVNSYGNVKKMIVETWDSGATFLKRQTTDNIYYSNEGERYGRLQSATVKTERRGAVDQTRIAQFTYYGYSGADCAGDEKLSGLLCSEHVSVSDTLSSEAPAKTMHYYDDFGNKAFSKTNERVSPMVEYDSKGRFAKATYDVFSSATGLGASSPGDYGNKIPAGTVAIKTSEVLLRDKFGNSLLSRAPVGSDNWLYSVQAATPMGTVYFKGDSTGAFEETQLQRTLLTNANWCPGGTVYISKVRKAGGAQASQCHDKVGRVTGAYTLGFDGKPIRTRKDYDRLGRVVKAFEPAQDAVPTLFTATSYDVLGRPLVVTHPFNVTSSTGTESTNTRAFTRFDYDGFTTTTTVAGHSSKADRIKAEVRNALGELTSVTEMGSRSITYTYDALGNLTHTQGPAGAPVVVHYNGLGQKTYMNDPDKGEWYYHYNGYGDLIRQVDANGTITTNDYDFKGRRITQSVQPLNVGDGHRLHWDYDLALNGLGQVGRERKTNLSNVVEFTRQAGFDSFGRASLTTTTFKGLDGKDESHYQRVTYDQHGRIFQTFDAARSGPQFNHHGVQNRYNVFGYRYRVEDAANGGSLPFYTVHKMDARGNVTEMLYGNGEKVTYNYHPRTGFVTDITRSLGTERQEFSAAWDHLGNMVSREHDFLGGTIETFAYDDYNRLIRNTLGGKPVEVKYDAIGNITNKSDQEGDALYSYHAVKKHAVEAVGNRSFKYDLNGNMTEERVSSVLRKKLTYTGNNLVSKIEVFGDKAHTSEFFYDTSNSRYKRVDTDKDGKVTTTLYLGSVEKVHNADRTVQWKRQVGGVAQVTHVVSAGVASAGTRHYLHKDHLGSIVAITNNAGMVEKRMAFDPWGARRTIDPTNNTWQPSSMGQAGILANYSKIAKPITNRGFTGHEMLDEVGIIHMNGRIYDASLGRFLQADPFIQSPAAVGSLNRYSYLMNNPMNAVDPTGFFWKKLFKNVLQFATGGLINTDLFKNGFRSVARMLGQEVSSFLVGIGSFFCGPAAPACAAIGTYNVARAFGASSSAAFKSGAIAGASAYAFQQIGAKFDGPAGSTFAKNGPLHVFSHGSVGGVSSVLQGGKFGHGFISAGFTKMMTPSIAGIDGLMIGDVSVAQAAVAGLIGGTISSATGGKFANGFNSAAFGNIFNQQMSAAAQKAHREASIKRLYGDILKAGNIDLDANMKLAASMSLDELGSALTDKSMWNYKRNSSLISALESSGNYDANLLAEFGNVHAGMAYGAAGIRLDFALTAGGAFQAFSQNIRSGNFSFGAAASSAAGLGMWFTGMSAPTRQTLNWAGAGFTWGDNSDDIWPIIQGFCSTSSTCD